jgi:hypothetical protein
MDQSKLSFVDMKPEQKEAIAKTSALTQEIIKSSGELSWQ